MLSTSTCSNVATECTTQMGGESLREVLKGTAFVVPFSDLLAITYFSTIGADRHPTLSNFSGRTRI
jgi:hypothetical protein